MTSSTWSSDDRPSLASEWTLEKNDQGQVFAIAESATKVLSGGRISEILTLLDGSRSVREIVSELVDVPYRKVVETLEALERDGLIIREKVSEMGNEESAFWRLTGCDPATVSRNRAGASCSVIVLDGGDSSFIEQTLAMAGVRTAPDAKFRFVVVRDPIDSRLAAINEECLRLKMEWMLVRPYGRRQWIGPLFFPGRTPCWECLSRWLKLNGWSASAVVAEWQLQKQATLVLAATQVARWLLTGHCETVIGRIREIDSRTLTCTDHCLLRSPTCECCLPGRVAFDKTVSRITGVTSRLSVMGEWPGLTVYTGATSQITGYSGAGHLYYCRSQDTFGVAECRADARMLCLAEGIERYSARFCGFERVIKATYRDLGHEAVHPDQLTLDHKSGTNWADKVIAWIPAVSLMSGRTRFVPAGLVYLSYDDEHFEVDTSGCAAGVSLETATVSGLFELIERDAAAIWWYNRLRRPRVDVASLSSKRISSVLEVAIANHLDIELLDLTTDFEVPVCVAVASGNSPGLAMGMAAHLDPEQCAWSALKEMTIGMTRLLAPPDDRQHWLDGLSVKDFGHLRSKGQITSWISQSQHARPPLTDLLERANRLELDVLRVELTRPELDVPVVRILAPGLRLRQYRLAPGRLYDVPVKLGWLEYPLSLDQMNPMPFAS
jgi:ribosomal protein S12 methylthiotransferase accessory factor YcaO/DNA-binding HxlR family transcriptional regulator